MSKNTIYALLLIALLVIIFVLNRGRVDVNFIVVKFSMLKSMAFLAFTAMGVSIGVLLK